MKLVQLSIVITVFVVCRQSIAATLSGSEDLSKALEELRRRRRWLESGVPLEYEPSHHEYGTINHFTPDMRKRQLHWAPALSKASLIPLPDDEDDKRKKRNPIKRSFFRERQHLDESDKKRKRWESDGDYDDTWQESEAELLKNLAQRRFLSTLLDKAQQEQARQTNQVPRFEESLELDQMDEDDVIELIELLKKQLADSGETKYYMEGEGSSDSSEEDIDRKKKLFAINKRYMWQDGIRYSLGDTPPSKRQYNVNDESGEEPWWVRVDPRLVEMLENSDEDERKRKREPDPWFPAFDVEDKRKYYEPMSGNWAKRKRSSVFRERAMGLGAGSESVKRKRLSSIKKRIPEVAMQERKRIVKKSIPEVSENQEKILDELKTIMADEKAPKVHRRDVDDVSTEEDVEPEVNTEVESEESPLSDYFGYDRREPSMKKRKRTWDEFVGIDKRADPKIHDDHEEGSESKTTLQPEADHMRRETDKPEVELNNSTARVKDVAEEEKETGDDDDENDDENDDDEDEKDENKAKRLNREKMQRYFNSIAAAMSVKKKRASEGESQEKLSEEPLEAMDKKLEAIENLMLEEVLGLVENNREPNELERNELRDKIVHRLDAAHSLEKVRQGLAEFDNSLDLIRRDREDEFEDQKKKKALVKKQSMSEALNVMAPENDKRNELNSDEDGESTCQIFAQIVNLCQDLNKAAGDSRGALVDACSRHIMCYACDYAYKDSPQIPCDLIFMREGHDICGDDVHCRSAAAQMHGILRQRAKVTQRANEAVCLSESCVRAYLRRRK